MTHQNKFIFVAPMFNASKTLEQMLYSICGQSYKNWKLILIDDISNDHERIEEANIIKSFKNLIGDNGRSQDDQKINVVWNKTKKWEVENVLYGISMCEDEDIICRIDADDWLTDLDALTYLNALYNQTGAEVLWSAHRWEYTDRNISGPMPPDADPYNFPWVSSHLKTFRKRLINDVNDINFRGEDGNYIRRAGDQAIYLPILFKTKKRGFVPRVFYHYTIDEKNGEIYQTDDAKFQKDEAEFLRRRGFIK
jgi:glycosyltransferase involved in cell wall biosynthesis